MVPLYKAKTMMRFSTTESGEEEEHCIGCFDAWHRAYRVTPVREQLLRKYMRTAAHQHAIRQQEEDDVEQKEGEGEEMELEEDDEEAKIPEEADQGGEVPSPSSPNRKLRRILDSELQQAETT